MRRAAALGLVAVCGVLLAVLVVLLLQADEDGRPSGTSCQDLAVRLGLAHDDLVGLERDLRSVDEEHAADAARDAASLLGVDVCGDAA